MIMFQEAAALILWLFIVPLFVGVLPTHFIQPKLKKLSTSYLCGWLVCVAIFQVTGSIFVLAGRPLTDLINVYTILMASMAIAGAIFVVLGLVRQSLSDFFYIPKFNKVSLSDYICWGIFFVLFLIQIGFSIKLATPNGDDSYYLSISLIADKLDGMYVLSPYTGFTEEFSFRHALSLFPMFYAFLARETGIHTAILAHRIMQPFLIMITYLIFYRIADSLYKDRKSDIPVFMILISVIQLFGATSIYTNEVFFLTRTWQGKSMLAAIAIPAVFCILHNISTVSDKNRDGLGSDFFGYFILLGLTNIFGGFASTLGLMLLCAYEGILLIIIAIRNKRSMVLIAGLASMLPNFIYMLFYVFA